MRTRYGARLTAAFAKDNWCTRIVGYDSGGGVEDLPSHVVTDPDGGRTQKCPTEVLIPDCRDAELSELGFLPLVNWKTHRPCHLFDLLDHRSSNRVPDQQGSDGER